MEQGLSGERQRQKRAPISAAQTKALAPDRIKRQTPTGARQRGAFNHRQGPAVQGQQHATTPLGQHSPEVTGRLLKALGMDLSGVMVRVDEGLIDKGKEGSYEMGVGIGLSPEVEDEARVLAHESIHAAQARGGTQNEAVAELSGRGLDVEAEAHQGAMAVLAGRTFHVANTIGKGVYYDGEPTGNGVTYSGTRVERPGRVCEYQNTVEVFSAPGGGSSQRTLGFNDEVFVLQRLSAQNMLEVVTANGIRGFVHRGNVMYEMPTPGCELHRVRSGETLLEIVREAYPGMARPGGDMRFLISALVYANAQNPMSQLYEIPLNQVPQSWYEWLFVPDEDRAWKAHRVQTGGRLWMPPIEFLRSLKGIVPSGSVTGGAWSQAQRAASAVMDFATYQIAFTAGLLHGALESVVDMFTGIIDLLGMVWDLFVSLFRGTILEDLSTLWDQISSMDISALASQFLSKWNDPDPFTRGHFRGWLAGYIVAEVVLSVVSLGTLLAVKSAGRVGRVARVVSELPAVQRIARSAERVASTQAQNPRLRQVREAFANDALDPGAPGLLARNMDERYRMASELLGRPLTSRQRNAIARAHEHGTPPYDYAALREKTRILREAGFTDAETSGLLRQGICGNRSPGQYRIVNPLGSMDITTAISRRGVHHQGRFPETITPNGNDVTVLYRRNNRNEVTAYMTFDAQGLPTSRVDVAVDSAVHAGVPAPHVVEYVDNVTPTGRAFRRPSNVTRAATAAEARGINATTDAQKGW